MFARMSASVLTLVIAPPLQAQTVTVAGGRTVKSASKHDGARLEGNFSWKPDWWSNDCLSLALNHAFSLAGFWDKNDVYLISWAPNIILTPANKTGFYPYFQFGISYRFDNGASF